MNKSRFSQALLDISNINHVEEYSFSEKPSHKNKHLFSDEQEDFLNNDSPKILLSALAGCGKTSCLIEYAKRRPNKKFNLLVLNKTLVDKLSKKLPKNMKMVNLHKVAFARHGKQLSHKLISSLSLNHVKKALSLNDEWCNALVIGLNNFCYSSDIYPSQIHAPLYFKNSEFWDGQLWDTYIIQLWEAALSDKSEFPITHDFYLKRFCQDEYAWRGGIWILDEAQDWANSVTQSFIKNTDFSIRAGDPCQRIFAFRGANQGGWEQEGEAQFQLRKSWRTSNDLKQLVNFYLKQIPEGWEWMGNSDIPGKVIPYDDEELILSSMQPDIVLADRWATLKKYKNNNLLTSTIHSAKGDEFNSVFLSKDILSRSYSSVMAARLMYIAITRASHEVALSNKYYLQTSNFNHSEEIDLIDDDFFNEN